MSDFQRSVDFVIDKLEGGQQLVTDPGGRTRYGISSRSHPNIDIIELKREQAVEIYRNDYWDVCGCDKYPWPMDLIIFDAAVNQGTAYAQLLGSTASDYIEALLLRVERYAEVANNNPSRRRYLLGWINRLMKILKEVQS